MNYLNAQDALPSRSLVPWDRTHRLVLAPIYEFPFGPGKHFLSKSGRVMGRIVGGWQVTMNTTLQGGNPMTVPNNVFLLRNPQLASPSWDRMFNTGFIDADGVTVRNLQSGEQPAFQIQPPFSLRSASQYFGNLRNRWGREYNLTLAKNTKIRESWAVQFRAEAFNLFNHPMFGGDPTLVRRRRISERSCATTANRISCGRYNSGCGSVSERTKRRNHGPRSPHFYHSPRRRFGRAVWAAPAAVPWHQRFAASLPMANLQTLPMSSRTMRACDFRALHVSTRPLPLRTARIKRE